MRERERESIIIRTIQYIVFIHSLSGLGGGPNRKENELREKYECVYTAASYYIKGVCRQISAFDLSTTQSLTDRTGHLLQQIVLDSRNGLILCDGHVAQHGIVSNVGGVGVPVHIDSPLTVLT